ncbi:MAG TPA: hypothetical protein VNQ79_18655 [Blastocatellia bacterium]|nr:hypothetical protein [Blastocatellia bacterium]
MTKRSAALIICLLETLRARHPDFDSELARCITRIRHKSSRALDSDDKAICAALRNGCNTVNDIADVTKLPPDTIYGRLRRMAESGEVYSTRVARAEGRGGDRRTRAYWLTDEPLN